MSGHQNIEVLIPEEDYEEFKSCLEEAKKLLGVSSDGEAILEIITIFNEICLYSQATEEKIELLKDGEEE